MMYHQSVLLNESVDGLNIKPDGIYVDVTFGGGGHSREILNHIVDGQLFAFDQDKDAQLNSFSDDRFTLLDHNFRYLKKFLKLNGVFQVDGVLADLGVSSHQFDVAERGFSIRFDADLDMRMNQNKGLSAKDLLNSYDLEELTRVFRHYGELKNAYSIAKSILSYREESPIQTTNDLKEAIQNHIPKFKTNKVLAQVFQAIRIEVNDELTALKEMLMQAVDLLKVGGRLSVISYHSLEDRLVKNIIKSGNFDGVIVKDFYGNKKASLKSITRKPVLATGEELENNSRARSAKLRIAEKL